ncbi:MAG: hypothetical protein H6R19_3212 [Proteobacteria bacterium]|nr:hypothetical protein [Pseudomonadota bacterium]
MLKFKLKSFLKLKPIHVTILSMLCIVAIWGLTYPLTRVIPRDAIKETFEPIYNGLNVLFTALAFGGVIATLLFQSDEAKKARREEIERSIFELFQTFTSQDFQQVKDSAFRVLLAAVQNRDYAEYVASRLFVVEQLPFPASCIPQLRALDEAKKTLPEDALVHVDRADRLMLDNALNFFAMLAQRESSAEVIKHCDFAYDWWRPVLWIVGQLQQDRWEQSAVIRTYCKNQLITVTLKSLDKIYGHAPLASREAVWDYVTRHPKILAFGLDPRFHTGDQNR